MQAFLRLSQRWPAAGGDPERLVDTHKVDTHKVDTHKVAE